MDKNQALVTIKNLIDQALASGVIKSVEQSAHVLQALQIIQKELASNNNNQ